MSVNCTYTLVGIIVSSILIAFGWYVTHNLTKSRELRKEIREIIDNFNEVLDKLLEATNKYYSGKALESQDISKSEILSLISRLRELPKETQEVIDNFNEILDKLLEAINRYHGDKALESKEIAKLEILSHISRLSVLIEVLEKRDTTLKLYQKFVPMYEAITGNDFESASLQPGHYYTEKCKRIILLAANIRQECENWYKTNKNKK